MPTRLAFRYPARALRLALAVVGGALGFTSLNSAAPVSGSVVYTSFFDYPRALLRAEFRYDGRHSATLGPAILVAELPGLADGITLLPEEGLAVGCGSTVAFINPQTQTVVSVPAGIDDAYHVMVDATGTNLWTANGYSLAVVPSRPPAPGVRSAFQENHIIPESVAWLNYRTVFFAADGVVGRLDPFDPAGIATMPVPGRAIAGPALVRDPWTEDLFLAGGRWIQQLRVVGGDLRLVSSRLLPEGVDLDHIDLDGRGHFFGANARGSLIFIDFSSDGLIGTTNHFFAAIPVPPSPGATAGGSVGSMDGVLFLRGFPDDPGGGGEPGGGVGGGSGPPPEWESDLVHWWPGDGTFEDVAGDAPVSPKGNAQFYAGAIGPAFHLQDSQAWLTAPPSRDWDLGGRDFTFAAWVWFDRLEPEGGLIGDYDPLSLGNHGRWVWEIRDRHLRFFTSRGAGTTGSIVEGPEFDPLARRWYHLALAKSGSKFQFYINGRLRREVSFPLVVPPQPGPLSLGPFTGGARLDDIRWYRKALSPDQVSDHYLSGDRLPRSPWAGVTGHHSNRIRMNFRMTAGRSWLLEQSSDLQVWAPAQTPPLTSGATVANLEVDASSPQKYFRVRSSP